MAVNCPGVRRPPNGARPQLIKYRQPPGDRARVADRFAVVC